AGQAAQRDRLTGQVSLFDSSPDSAPLERPLPDNITEAPPRERLRWEKELLGLYLSDHPLGELAGVIGEYVTAYSGELGEELDQQRICVGGVVTEVRRVITKARATMGVATLEDLQGTMEVIVFPKVFEQTETTWAEDAILLVAGRVDHKGEETVLLADAVWTWEDAQALGSPEFGRALARTDRGRRNGSGNNFRNGGSYDRSPTAVGPGTENAPGASVERTRTIHLVSPLRGVDVSGSIEVRIGGAPKRHSERPGATPAAAAAPSPPRPMAAEPFAPAAVATALPETDEEPPLPDEAVERLVAEEQAATMATEASAGRVLHVRFTAADQEAVVAAFQALREIIHERPGDTSVVLHIPAGPGRSQRMELRVGVAYDSELVSGIKRRVGDAVELSLS
ncbi:MAG TPA: OB-fold nucleic acid binding domain-containing protein, partial [Candidatus Limnocylindrales bacterium]|nr:OB-fold nucleic acid binding domain-containing protein [Candidatus Limnocylindrales bacterium]